MIPSDPRQTFPEVLECDRQTPRDRQPRFWLRFPTAAEAAAMQALRDGAEGLQRAELIDRLFSTVEGLLSGWNLSGPAGAIPFGSGALRSAVTIGEAWELFHAALARCSPTADELKNSASPLRIAAGESAGAAPA